MRRTLMILEISGKQDYIFSAKKLRENEQRSEEIAYLTGSAFFREAAGELYDEETNLVYAGGGHTVLQFSDEEAARAFARKVSETVLRVFGDDGPEYFVKLLPWDGAASPGDNLRALSEALERKKALRRGSFVRRSAGVEALDPADFRPLPLCGPDHPPVPSLLPGAPAGWSYPREFGALAGRDNFIAVVHIDGNAMGARVRRLYEREPTPLWEDFCAGLRRFSAGIQADYEAAFRRTAEAVAARQEAWSTLELEEGTLPIRPVILAGDDVCFVTAGSLGLECARVFLERLAERTNPEDGLPYAACAGVALVHTKYPFRLAYALAEELCGSAKRLGAALDPEGRVSAMDWHIEFGQLQGSLKEIRDACRTEDGGTLELRPVAVHVPDGIDAAALGGVRTWAFFRSLCRSMRGEYGSVARGKIKDFRAALRQGEVESRFFLAQKEVSDFLDHVFSAEHADAEIAEAFAQMQREGRLRKEAFRELGGVKRSLFFDALEMIDRCIFFEEAGE